MKTWLDVSGLYNWHGNFTGIQRVMYSLGKELYAANSDAGFFIYRAGGFHPVSFADLEGRVQEGSKSPRRAPMTSAGGRRLASPRLLVHHGIVTLKRTIRGTKLDPPLRAAYGRLRAAYRSTKGRRPSITTSSPFKPDDIVVVIDGNWQFGGFVEAMAAAKKQTHFRLVHMVHDLVAVRNPALANRGADKIIGDYFKKMLTLADLLLTISDSTTRDVEWFVDKFDVRSTPEIMRVTLGDNIVAGGARKSSKPDVKLPDKFILAVSTIEVRKNYEALYYAYKLAIQKGIALPHLVIVGRKGWMAEETYALLTQDTEIKDKVSILSGITDPELEWLYQHCQFTVFPSFYEGWGLPVAESFARGKACISSNTSSMPEVGGDLAVYVSPYDPGEMMKNIERLATSSALRKEIESKIKAQYTPRGWDKTNEEFLNALRSVCIKSEAR